MREFFEKHKEKIITLLLCGVLLIIVLSVLALISGAIMKVFGCNNYFLSVRIDCRCITKGFIIFRQSINAYSNNTLSNLRHIRNFLGIKNYRLLYAKYFS